MGKKSNPVKSIDALTLEDILRLDDKTAATVLSLRNEICQAQYSDIDEDIVEAFKDFDDDFRMNQKNSSNSLN